MRRPPAPGPPEGPPRLVCRCVGVSSVRIAAAIRSGGLRDAEQVRTATGAGAACGTCALEIREILTLLSGGEVPAEECARNLDAARMQTAARVEASLWGAVGSALPPGASVELLGVDGLRVDLRLEPDEPALRERVAAKLRKLVCEDLEPRFAAAGPGTGRLL